MARFSLETSKINLAHLRQRDCCALAEMVLEIGVDDRPALLVDVLDEIAQAQASEFQQGDGDVFPPWIRQDLEQEGMLGGNRRNGCLLLKGGHDLQKLLLQPVEALRALQQRQLHVQHQKIETLRLLAFGLDLRGQRRDLAEQLVPHLV